MWAVFAYARPQWGQKIYQIVFEFLYILMRFHIAELSIFQSTDYRHPKSKKPENLGQCIGPIWGRQNMLRPYPQIWAMLWSRFPQRASVVRVSKDDSIVKLQCFETSNDEIYKKYFAPLWPAVEPIEFIFYLDHNFTKIEWSRQNRPISLNLNKSGIPSLVWQNVGINL